MVLKFTLPLDADGWPLGETAALWNRVLNSVSFLPGWRSTHWGPQSDDKHGLIVITVWKFLSPPQDFPFSHRQPVSQSSPLRPITHLLMPDSRLLNVPLFPQPHFGIKLGIGSFELELLYLPQQTQFYKDRMFHHLFDNITQFVERQGNRIDSLPYDFRSGHHGWLSDEETLESVPVHIILLQYESLEAERHFKDPNAVQSPRNPEKLYQHRFLDPLAGLADYGVQRESLHFRLNFRALQPVYSTPRDDRCCTIQ
ncbi:MAG: hypothetical protein Q9178_007040 [Gyalolechia marmorata]